MPIDPNIAMGVRPIEQPNMLGQMAQAMQIRQANQEYEDVNAMRGISAKYGGDISNPDFLKEVGMRSPKTAADLRAKALANDKTTGEIVKSRLETSRELLSNVRTPEEYLAWHQGNHKDPLLGPLLASKGITADTSMATIQESLKRPGGFEELLKKSAMGLEKFYADQTSRANAATGAAPSHRQASIAEQRFAIEKAQQAEIDALFGKPPSAAPTAAPTTGGGGGSGGVAPSVAPMSAPAGVRVPNALPATVGATPAAPVANMLVPGAQAPVVAQTPAAAPATPAPVGDVYAQIQALDAKIAPLVNTGNPRASAIVQQLIAQRNALMETAKKMYGGAETTMEVIDPATGLRTTVKARPNEYGELVAMEMKPVPLSTDASATGGTGISPTVARPAPTPAVLKERQAVEKLPEAIAMNNDAIRKIDEMIGGVDANGKPLAGAKGKPHPGFSEAVGAAFGTAYIPGTQGKSFTIRHKEVLSQAFLDAFEALKGGGAITEKEGEKATAARTRMDLSQSESEYITAAREYQGVLKRGVENARARMQRSGTAPPASTAATPETNVIEFGSLK